MKSSFHHFCLLLLILCVINSGLMAQNNMSPNVRIPFDSLQITGVTLTGNQLKRSVTIRVKVKNAYFKRATVHFKFGDYDEFGIVDGMGKKYKIYTRDDLMGTSDINKGFGNISSVVFGSQKLDYFTYLRADLNSGEEKSLDFVILGVDKKTETFRELHLKCRLLFDTIIQGEGMFRIEAMKVEWLPSSGKVKNIPQ